MCKTISSWVRKVLCNAKAHMPMGAVQGTAASVTLAVGVSLASILQVADWARFQHKLDIILPHISLLQIGTSLAICWAVRS